MLLIIRPVLASALIVLFGTGLLFAAELDDSTLFVEAFYASQKKDYLLAIEKIDQLNQLFPDTPLRDVSLLLLARAGMGAGDNQLAAKAVNRFSTEFGNSSLKESLEDELLVLGKRLKNGERLEPAKPLQIAANRIRDARIASERALADKTVQAHLTRERSEQERVAKEKAESGRQLQLRLAAEKVAKESIKLAIIVPKDGRSYGTDGRGRLQFELINKGTAREEFRLATTAAPEYALRFHSADSDGKSVERVLIAAGKKLKVVLSFQVPPDKIDGYKIVLPISVVSGRFADIGFSKEIVIHASAPLLRVVAKPSRMKVQPGEMFQYRITLINAGSMAARKLKVRISLPPHLVSLKAKEAGYQAESDSTVVAWIETLVSGGLKELILPVRVKEEIEDHADLRCLVEVNNEQLGRRDKFSFNPVSISMK